MKNNAHLKIVRATANDGSSELKLTPSRNLSKNFFELLIELDSVWPGTPKPKIDIVLPNTRLKLELCEIQTAKHATAFPIPVNKFGVDDVC